MEFIEKGKPEGCIFCRFPAESGVEPDRRNLIVARSARSFAILNRYPYNSGHLMVIPFRHTADFAGLSDEESGDLHRLLRLSLKALDEIYRPDGYNVGMNLGRSAGAGIEEHLHYHVVPRWIGDTNFMPVLSATKVMIESLGQAHDKLGPVFARLQLQR